MPTSCAAGTLIPGSYYHSCEMSLKQFVVPR